MGEGREEDENDGRRGRTSEKKNMDNSWPENKWNPWGMKGGYEMGCPTFNERDCRRRTRYGTQGG
jgi:hypothetical protein